MSKEVVILVHGWDTAVYNNQLAANEKARGEFAWRHRTKLVELLKRRFELEFYVLPGFCGNPEPKARSYNVEDFTDDFASWLAQRKTPILIVGYSFGGVIALDYKVRYKPETRIALISPALKRRETTKSNVAHLTKRFIPNSYLDTLKGLYQLFTSEYYRKGTKFIRFSYDLIVRRDMSSLLQNVDPREIFLIYGENDKDTPWGLVQNRVLQTGIDYLLIPNGEHNIGQMYPKEIYSALVKFLDRQ